MNNEQANEHNEQLVEESKLRHMNRATRERILYLRTWDRHPVGVFLTYPSVMMMDGEGFISGYSLRVAMSVHNPADKWNRFRGWHEARHRPVKERVVLTPTTIDLLAYNEWGYDETDWLFVRLLERMNVSPRRTGEIADSSNFERITHHMRLVIADLAEYNRSLK